MNNQDDGIRPDDFKAKITELAPVTMEHDDDDIESLVESENFKMTSNNKRAQQDQSLMTPVKNLNLDKVGPKADEISHLDLDTYKIDAQ